MSGRFLPAPCRWHNEGEQPLHLRCRCSNLHSKHLSGIHHWLGRASHQSSEACLHILIIMTSAPSQQHWLEGGGRRRHLIMVSSEVLRNFITLARFIWRSPRCSQLCLLTFLLAPHSHDGIYARQTHDDTEALRVPNDVRHKLMLLNWVLEGWFAVLNNMRSVWMFTS